MSPRYLLAAFVFMSLLWVASAPATILTFRDASDNFLPSGELYNGYGNRVTGNLDLINNHGYVDADPADHPTPNVTATFGNDIVIDPGGFDLSPAARQSVDFVPFSLTLSADPGWHVSIPGWVMFSWEDGGSQLDYIEIRDSHNVLFSETNYLISDLSHTKFYFEPPVTGSTLTLEFLVAEGSDHESVGIGYIVFRQFEVIPGPLALPALGLFMLGHMLRRSRQG